MLFAPIHTIGAESALYAPPTKDNRAEEGSGILPTSCLTSQTVSLLEEKLFFFKLFFLMESFLETDEMSSFFVTGIFGILSRPS